MFAQLTNRVCCLGLVVVAMMGWCPVADAQERPTVADAKQAAEDSEVPVLRTYEVGDLVIEIKDHPFNNWLQRASQGGGGTGGGGGFGGGGGGFFSVPEESRRVGRVSGGDGIFQLAQVGGGGGGMGMEGGAAGTHEDGPSASISIADLVRVITSTVLASSWDVQGGDGHIEPLGTTLIVWQFPAVHERIGELLDALRNGSAKRRTLTIDARWLLLTSDELDSLVLPDQKGVPLVDPAQLARLTRRASSIRGITNCLSSQLVYVVSGTMKNIVSGYIPVVGSVESPDGGVQLAGRRGVRGQETRAQHGRETRAQHGSRAQHGATGARIHLVADAPALGTPRGSGVGYQPIVQSPNFGAVLEIRPTLVPSTKSDASAVVDLKSMVTVEAGISSDAPSDASSAELAPAVDRVAIDTQEFATTLRMPLGKPVLVGGMTNIPSAKGAGDGNNAEPAGDSEAAAERPQMYLVLEVK